MMGRFFHTLFNPLLNIFSKPPFSGQEKIDLPLPDKLSIIIIKDIACYNPNRTTMLPVTVKTGTYAVKKIEPTDILKMISSSIKWYQFNHAELAISEIALRKLQQSGHISIELH